MPSDLPGDDLVDARALLHQCFRVLAEQTGRWHQEKHMAWWLSGLPAIGANVLVECGVDPQPERLQALAGSLACLDVPVGWLIWPDQTPSLQQAILQTRGFQFCECLWLGRLAPGELKAPAYLSQALPLEIRQLIPHDAPALAELYGVCHQIPSSFADVAARAFLPRSSPVVSTFGGFLPVDGSLQPELVAAITVILDPRPRSAQNPSMAGLAWLGTHPNVRRCGVASRLTRLVCQTLIRSGVSCIHVQASPAATGLYPGLGFRSYGRLELWGRQP